MIEKKYRKLKKILKELADYGEESIKTGRWEIQYVAVQQRKSREGHQEDLGEKEAGHQEEKVNEDRRCTSRVYIGPKGRLAI